MSQKTRTRLSYWVGAIAIVLLIFLNPSHDSLINSLAQAQASTEIRGVWVTNVDSDVLFSTAGVEEMVQRLTDYQFNTLSPAAWSWGYTLYPSQVVLSQKRRNGRLGDQFPRVIYRQFRVHVPSCPVQMEALSA